MVQSASLVKVSQWAQRVAFPFSFHTWIDSLRFQLVLTARLRALLLICAHVSSVFFPFSRSASLRHMLGNVSHLM